MGPLSSVEALDVICFCDGGERYPVVISVSPYCSPASNTDAGDTSGWSTNTR